MKDGTFGKRGRKGQGLQTHRANTGSATMRYCPPCKPAPCKPAAADDDDVGRRQMLMLMLML